MKKLDRITECVMKVEGGSNIYRVQITKDCDITGAMNHVLERLGQYEDTGLSPEDIITMYKTGGYWKKKYEDVYMCSNCNKSNNAPTTFCPHCGCQMSAPMIFNAFEPSISNNETKLNESLIMRRDYVDYKIDKENHNKRVAVDADGNIIDHALYEGDVVFEVPANYRVHQAHCCVIHGCKYGDDDCPVAQGKIKQQYLCYECTDPLNIKRVEWQNLHSVYREKRMAIK